MKILQGLGEALLAVRDQAEEMEGFCMVWRKFERLPVGRFCLCQAIGLLMDASLFEPGFDRRRGSVGVVFLVRLLDGVARLDS